MQLSPTLLVLIALPVIVALGFVRLRQQYKDLMKDRNFAVEYLDHYRGFVSQKKFNTDLYEWLTLRVSKIQRLMGGFGRMSYRPPFARYVINNYEVIMNTLPDIKSGMAHEIMIDAVQECLVRYIGHMDEKLEESRQTLVNPFMWFREGFQFIVLTPILIVYWMGIIGSSTVKSIEGNVLFQLITAVVGLISLIASIVTIIAGWDYVRPIIDQWF